jgi:Tol biopolymer transport system component
MVDAESGKIRAVHGGRDPVKRGVDDHLPIWSPDGADIAFEKHRLGASDIFVKPANGAVPERRLVDGGGRYTRVTDWSRDGRFIVFEKDRSVGGGYDIWVLPLSGDRQPFRYVGGRFNNRAGAVSPDGRWMAHMTNESGDYQVMVQPFPDASQGKWQVSPSGGTAPRWAREGRELYYMDMTGAILKVDVTTEPAFRVGQPVTVSPVAADSPRLGATVPATDDSVVYQWDVTRDGQRILRTAPQSVTAAAVASPSPITVVLNWMSLLEK